MIVSRIVSVRGTSDTPKYVLNSQSKGETELCCFEDASFLSLFLFIVGAPIFFIDTCLIVAEELILIKGRKKFSATNVIRDYIFCFRTIKRGI